MQQLYSHLPTKPGVYIFKNQQKKVIYVGKANDLKKRVSSYFNKQSFLDPKVRNLVPNISTIDCILVSSEIEALLLEANLIKKYQPFYNIKLADDKFYPYIIIGKNNIPYVSLTRKKNEKKAAYYGPYTEVNMLKSFLKVLRRIFPYQTVRNHSKRKCLYHHLNLCPCIPVFPEKFNSYKKDIKKIEEFLQGKKGKIITDFEKERDQFAKNEEFEKANIIQKKINTINFITSNNYNVSYYEKDPNLYFERIKGENESLLLILNEYFKKLNKLDKTECFDISNTMGTNATGSMVVFIKGEPNKNLYRRFKIRCQSAPDDYKMMQEMLSRRLKHKEWEYPDLIVIDGGKGQVGAVAEILLQYKLEIPLIGLAKKEEKIIIADYYSGKIYFFEEKLPLSTPGLNLLRRIRDEAHRFALKYHKFLRKKILKNSFVDL